MGRMSDRAIVIEDVENLVENSQDPRIDPTDVDAVLKALCIPKTRAEILAMPALARMPIIRQYLDAYMGEDPIREGNTEGMKCQGNGMQPEENVPFTILADRTETEE